MHLLLSVQTAAALHGLHHLAPNPREVAAFITENVSMPGPT